MYPMGLSDGYSPIMNHIHLFHDTVMVVVISIVSLVFFVFLCIVCFPVYGREMSSSETLEMIWTVLPCVVLTCLAAPSLYILYLSDEVGKPVMTLKAIGHQWYWSYEYGDSAALSFDSYMLPFSEVEKGGFRLLEVDKRCFLPMRTEIRVLVTSSDVIHSWTLPSLGVKVDAIPGRLNQISLFSSSVGVFYGQCSEICGAHHSFMPICVEFATQEGFMKALMDVLPSKIVSPAGFPMIV